MRLAFLATVLSGALAQLQEGSYFGCKQDMAQCLLVDCDSNGRINMEFLDQREQKYIVWLPGVKYVALVYSKGVKLLLFSGMDVARFNLLRSDWEEGKGGKTIEDLGGEYKLVKKKDGIFLMGTKNGFELQYFKSRRFAWAAWFRPAGIQTSAESRAILSEPLSEIFRKKNSHTCRVTHLKPGTYLGQDSKRPIVLELEVYADARTLGLHMRSGERYIVFPMLAFRFNSANCGLDIEFAVQGRSMVEFVEKFFRRFASQVGAGLVAELKSSANSIVSGKVVTENKFSLLGTELTWRG